MIRIATLDDAPRLAELAGLDESVIVDGMDRMTMLIHDHGGFFLEPITPSVLEAHMFFQPGWRGRNVIEAAREGLAIAFGKLNAAVVFGRIPTEDRAARLITRLIGFIPCGIRAKVPGGELHEWFEMRSPRLCRQ